MGQFVMANNDKLHSTYINIKDPKEGEAADTNVLSCHLKEAEVDVTVPSFLGWMIDGTCEALVFENFQTKLCAGKSGVDSCQGDSGCTKYFT